MWRTARDWFLRVTNIAIKQPPRISRDRKINYWTQSSKLFPFQWLKDLISGG